MDQTEQEQVEEQPVQNLYAMLQSMNILKPIEKQLVSGNFKLNDLGRVEVRIRRDPNRGWQLFKGDPRRECERWNEIYCQYYQIIPKACRGCWKVVLKVENLRQLFWLVGKMSEKKGFISKCGVDRRWSSGNFGACMGYWYAPLSSTKAEALRFLGQVREALGTTELPLVLKRGCTEMEALLPSNKWDEAGPRFDPIEKQLDSVFQLERPSQRELEFAVINTHQNWIFWRAQLGDESYKEFTGGQAFWPEAVQYQNDSLIEEIS